MSQRSEDLLSSFFVRCSDVGLDCSHVIFGDDEDSVMKNAISHMCEYHAIDPDEMTTCMKMKIMENMHLYRDLLRAKILNEFSDVSEKLLPVI
jgi:predicted small metal-binding protein